MPRERDALVGRDDALARVRGAVEAARRGAGAAVLVSGSAGMGKTSLLRAALEQAEAEALVWGTCVEGDRTPGYWPWTQALSGLVRAVGLHRARAAAGADAPLLAALAPALDPGSTPAEPAEPSERSRLLLLDAAVAWLHALAAERPVVVVLDDLQWVDNSSLALLELVVQDPRPTPVCVLGAFRPDEAPGPLGTRLAALAGRVEHLRLRGLDQRASTLLAARAAGRPLPAATADAIFRRAGGHPFFTRELALAAVDGLEQEAVPGAVREAVARRLRTLPPDVQAVLRAAAVGGPTVLPDVLAAATGLAVERIRSAMTDAAAAGVLVDEQGRLRFAHDLFREAVEDGVDVSTRPALHLAVGAALEGRSERAGDVAAADLARHYRAAVGCGGLDRAVLWALRAAEADCAALALSEAVQHLRRLRAAVADAGLALSDEQTVDVLLAEADVLARLGRSPDARGLVRAARAAADRCGDAGRTTRAALAAAALGSRFAARRDEVVAELESAQAAVAGRDDGLEARLTAALARELQHSVPEQRARARPLSERALQLGRSTGQPEVLADCLLARHDVLWTPGCAGQRSDVATELVALTQRSAHRERHAEALLLQANALLESGSAAFAPALDRCLELLEGLGQPRHRYTVLTRRACVTLLRGQLDEGAALVEQARELGERLREPDAENVRMSQRLELVRARADPEQLLTFAAQAVTHWSGAPVHAHGVAAGFCARAGDLDAARHHASAVYALGTWRADRSYLWSVFVRELAVAAVAMGDRDLCRELLDELRPLAGSCGVNGAVVAFAGCHSHTAGRLALALGDSAEARALLNDSCAVYQRLGAALLAEAQQEVRELVGHPAAAAAGLRRRGPVWEVSYAGRTATLGHCKGLLDLAQLVQRPGVDVHVLDLVRSPVRGADGGEVLDRTAVTNYRQRLAVLAAERQDAEQRGDAARLLALDSEHDAIVTELRTGSGLGGRPRAFTNTPVERARKAVTARLRDAVRRVGAALPELGAHLDRSVVTGVTCRYRGQERWHVET